MSILRPCLRSGCSALVDRGYCDKHKVKDSEIRGTSTERGYDYRWQQFRRWYLSQAEHVMCRIHTLYKSQSQCRQIATDVHHVIKLRDRPDLKYDQSNLVGLCSRHHDELTRQGK
jgi:5-methylcytosine-specific restriction protein A